MEGQGKDLAVKLVHALHEALVAAEVFILFGGQVVVERFALTVLHQRPGTGGDGEQVGTLAGIESQFQRLSIVVGVNFHRDFDVLVIFRIITVDQINEEVIVVTSVRPDQHLRFFFGHCADAHHGEEHYECEKKRNHFPSHLDFLLLSTAIFGTAFLVFPL